MGLLVSDCKVYITSMWSFMLYYKIQKFVGTIETLAQVYICVLLAISETISSH